jgi:hypothetical protein
MGARPKIFHHRFAGASPVFADRGLRSVKSSSRPGCSLLDGPDRRSKQARTYLAFGTPKVAEARNAGRRPGAYAGACMGLLGFLLLCFPAFALAAGPGTTNPTARRQAASAQFARAEELQAALNDKAAGKRSLAEYKQVVSSYHRVYLITPHAPEVPESLAAVAGLYVEMGGRFGRS